jgi:succinate dehydrogenase/fumarate reductase cytochrome b subunit
MFVSIAVLLIFVFVGLLGLLAAKRPHIFVRHFLADWQRERLEGNMGAVSWTGWMIFAFAVITVVAMLISGEVGR